MTEGKKNDITELVVKMAKKILKQKKVAQYELPIQIKVEKGVYLASCPIWPDCYAQGETIDEAVVEITAVAGSLIEIYQEENLKVPLKLKTKTLFLKKSLIQVPVFVPAT